MLLNLQILIDAPIFNVQLLFNGLMVGAIFALAAYGLALVWGVMNVKNLCQGEFVIMGGYIAYYMYTLGIHPLWGLPVAMVIMFAFGWAMYRLIISKVIDRDLFTSLLATFGLAIVMQQALNLVFGPEVVIAESGMENRIILGDVAVQDIRILSFVIACLLAVAVVLFMKKSRMGQAIRATAQDARAARVMGINTDRVYAFTYSLNAAICGAAGGLISMIWVIQPFYGITHSIRAFVIVVAAGLGNLPGVIIAGLGLGIAEQYGGFVLGTDFQQVTVTGLLVVVLVILQIKMARQRQVVE
ncbi:MAG: branched-chain amino acid ABC transporter permease [Proteobacteria bacterium]|nr:branched-chain amino acid ABC transporter permease [Pseudomonadota bacterium]MCK4866788.1 branched-chain amino acid ABC transporter permease [Alphaproteobacteria bacterium]